jgi:hypothetical protein
VHLLSFSKLPPYYPVNNILPNWNIKNITIQNHEALVLIMEVCNPSYQVFILPCNYNKSEESKFSIFLIQKKISIIHITAILQKWK